MDARIHSWQWLLRNLSVSCRVNQFLLCNYSYVVHTEYIYFYFFINWTLRMSDNLPERVQILCHAHIICNTVLENRIICCQLFCDLLLKSALERIFNVMQLILVKIKWHIKWKYLIQKFHDIGLSYYLKCTGVQHNFIKIIIVSFKRNMMSVKRLTMIHKTLRRKLNIEQYKPH
jgi:hypothetical protein